MNPMELFKFVQSQFRSESDQVNALAALQDAPPEDYQPLISLPMQNKIPAFKLGNGSLGSILANQDFGIAAPMIDEAAPAPSIGQLLVGEDNGR